MNPTPQEQQTCEQQSKQRRRNTYIPFPVKVGLVLGRHVLFAIQQQEQLALHELVLKRKRFQCVRFDDRRRRRRRRRSRGATGVAVHAQVPHAQRRRERRSGRQRRSPPSRDGGRGGRWCSGRGGWRTFVAGNGLLLVRLGLAMAHFVAFGRVVEPKQRLELAQPTVDRVPDRRRRRLWRRRLHGDVVDRNQQWQGARDVHERREPAECERHERHRDKRHSGRRSRRRRMRYFRRFLGRAQHLDTQRSCREAEL